MLYPNFFKLEPDSVDGWKSWLMYPLKIRLHLHDTLYKLQGAQDAFYVFRQFGTVIPHHVLMARMIYARNNCLIE